MQFHIILIFFKQVNLFLSLSEIKRDLHANKVIYVYIAFFKSKNHEFFLKTISYLLYSSPFVFMLIYFRLISKSFEIKDSQIKLFFPSVFNGKSQERILKNLSL